MFQSERLSNWHNPSAPTASFSLVVRRLGERYSLVAGERRWRAAKLVASVRAGCYP